MLTNRQNKYPCEDHGNNMCIYRASILFMSKVGGRVYRLVLHSLIAGHVNMAVGLCSDTIAMSIDRNESNCEQIEQNDAAAALH